MRVEVRDFNRLPLLTPGEALERAREMGWNRPLFDLDYRVRGLGDWKTLEALLRQYDIEDAVIASFGLKSFEEILDVIAMLHERGWHLWQTSAKVYVDSELRAVQAIRAHYPGD